MLLLLGTFLCLVGFTLLPLATCILLTLISFSPLLLLLLLQLLSVFLQASKNTYEDHLPLRFAAVAGLVRVGVMLHVLHTAPGLQGYWLNACLLALSSAAGLVLHTALLHWNEERRKSAARYRLRTPKLPPKSTEWCY